MIDLATYNLIYIRKEDGRKFLGKMITKMHRKLIDSLSGKVLDVTEHELRKYYRPDKKSNQKNMIKRFKKR